MKNYIAASLVLTLSIFGCKLAEAPISSEILSPDQRWGALFEAVQMTRVFPDGKTFVDCTPRMSDKDLMTAYAKESITTNFDLKKFVETHFVIPNSPTEGYHSDTTQSVEAHITELWPLLTRKPDQYDPKSTLISLPNPYIVPGGRFREIYYWDSYFTILGLLADNQTEMVGYMLDNFAHLIKTVGHIPNGNRTYYLSRSQPPFFASMVSLLARQTDEKTILVKYLPAMQGEYDFWMQGANALNTSNSEHRRVVRLADGALLNRYYDDREVPRPESWREDVETAQKSGRPAPEIYRHLRAGAESGWDYSTRWFADGKNIATIHTTDIIPPDLNALMFKLEQTLAAAYAANNQPDQAKKYALAATNREAAILKYCWDNTDGIFRDFDFRTQKQTTVASLATVFPPAFGIACDHTRIANYLEKNLLQPGGLLTTANKSGQQWDAPNGWPPLQYLAVIGLADQPIAAKVSDRWVAMQRKVYKKTGKMLEKYNVSDLTLTAGGGEYPVQDGFGWTNGVFKALSKGKLNN